MPHKTQEILKRKRTFELSDESRKAKKIQVVPGEGIFTFFPADVLFEILKHLEPFHRYYIRYVCKRWMNIINDRLTSICLPDFNQEMIQRMVPCFLAKMIESGLKMKIITKNQIGDGEILDIYSCSDSSDEIHGCRTIIKNANSFDVKNRLYFPIEFKRGYKSINLSTRISEFIYSTRSCPERRVIFEEHKYDQTVTRANQRRLMLMKLVQNCPNINMEIDLGDIFARLMIFPLFCEMKSFLYN